MSDKPTPSEQLQAELEPLPEPPARVICKICGRDKIAKCDDGWLPPIGPCSDDSYITMRPCQNA